MDTEEYEDIPRRDYPHHTTVTMKIDIRKINTGPRGYGRPSA